MVALCVPRPHIAHGHNRLTTAGLIWDISPNLWIGAVYTTVQLSYCPSKPTTKNRCVAAFIRLRRHRHSYRLSYLPKAPFRWVGNNVGYFFAGHPNDNDVRKADGTFTPRFRQKKQKKQYNSRQKQQQKEHDHTEGAPSPLWLCRTR